jgi:hypothetical protein
MNICASREISDEDDKNTIALRFLGSAICVFGLSKNR